jgi:hypothetical protein
MKKKQSLFSRITLLCLLSSLFAPPSWAGTGRIVNSTPDYVNLNLYYTYLPADPAVMKSAFQEASRLLYNSSNGQICLGTIRVSTNSAFQNKADVWVNSGAAGAYSNVGALGTSGTHMTLFENRHKWTNEDGPGGNERGQFGIIHEFGHYGFNLYDEYDTGSYPGAACVSAASTVGCIMDGGTTMHPQHHRTEWCTVAGGGLTSSHITAPNTPQQAIHSHSCWEEIVSYMNSKYAIATTAPTTVNTGDPAGLGTIGWVKIGDRLRYTLALDRSYSMSVDNKEPLSKQAAALFVDLCKKDVGESIGVVSFSNTAVSNYPEHEVTTAPDVKTDAINAINGIVLENMTALGDGLRRSLNEITGFGSVSADASAAEAIVLMSDGVHNFGAEAPSAVLPDLRSRGVRVFTVGLGDSTDPVYPLDESTLLDISNQTGGLYTHALNAADLSTIYANYAAEIRGMDSYPEASGSLERGASSEHKVLVDAYTKEESFLIHWPFGDDAFTLQVKRPDGTLVAAGVRGVELVKKKRYWFYRIQNPEPGTWTMVVSASKIVKLDQKLLNYKAQALAKAPGLSVRVASRDAFYKLNQPVVLRAFVFAAGVPVAKAEVSGLVRLPNGKSAEIRLVDDGNFKTSGDEKANDGVYTALFRNSELVGSYEVNVKINAQKSETAAPDEMDKAWKPLPISPFIRQAKSSFMIGTPQIKRPTTEKRK